MVNAPGVNTAAAKAELHHHRTIKQDTDTVVRPVEPCAPTADHPWAYNGLRGIPVQAIVLTPTSGRSHTSGWALNDSIDISPDETCTEQKAQIIDDMTAYVTTLVRRLVDDLDYSA